MLPPGNTVILLFDGGKRMPTKSRCRCQVPGVKFASKLDFSAEALVAHPCLRHPWSKRFMHASLISKFLLQSSNVYSGGLEIAQKDSNCGRLFYVWSWVKDSRQMFQYSNRMFEQTLQILISFKISLGA